MAFMASRKDLRDGGDMPSRDSLRVLTVAELSGGCVIRIATCQMLLIMFAAALPIGVRNADAATIYVNAKTRASVSQDGTSWKTAFANLQDALDKAATTPGS